MAQWTARPRWSDASFRGQASSDAANRGFAAAVNQGIRASATPWVALLNNDALADAGWLAELLAVGETDARVGSVASRMMFRHAPGMVASAGIRLDPSAAPWDLLLGERRWPDAPLEVFGASGGACLLRRAMLDDVGLFDEGYFAYLEDVDLAWRARLRGWRCLLAPNAVVHHALSSTAGEGSPFKRYRLARNKWRTIVRNYPREGLLRHAPAVLAYDALSVGNSLLHGDLVPLRGRLAAARELPQLLAQRRDIQARRTASWPALRSHTDSYESPLRLRERARLVASIT